MTAPAQPKQEPAAAVLQRILMAGYYLAHTPEGMPFAADMTIPSVMIPLTGTRGLRQRLMMQMYLATGRHAPNEALAQVMSVAEGAAMMSFTGVPHLRVAALPDGRIFFDLGRRDGLAALISPAGWELTTRVPVLFRRSPLTSELPVPAGPGSIGGMRHLVNVRGDDEWSVYTACRIVSLIPGVTRPVELFTGQPGAAKTHTTRISAWWTGGDVVPMQRELSGHAATMGNAHTVGHDNVSGISAERSDLLCKAASGDSWADRKKYTDAELFVLRFAPVSILVNGIEVGALRGDLVRRTVAHYLLRPDAYLDEREVAGTWQCEHPAALGWLLSTTAAVLARMPYIRVPPGEPMSTFAHVLLCIDAIQGTRGYRMWKDGQQELHAEMAESDTVALTLRRCITGPWEGTASQLLERLGMALPPPAPGQAWTPVLLARRIDRCQSALEATGWKIERLLDGHTKTRRIRLLPPS